MRWFWWQELILIPYHWFRYSLRIWAYLAKEKLIYIFSSKRSRILRELQNVCGVCGHPKLAHTWMYGGKTQGEVQDCGWVVHHGFGIFTDDEKTCWCPKFTTLSPLEICEQLEDRLQNNG